jgi:hypothetical protein
MAKSESELRLLAEVGDNHGPEAIAQSSEFSAVAFEWVSHLSQIDSRLFSSNP